VTSTTPGTDGEPGADAVRTPAAASAPDALLTELADVLVALARHLQVATHEQEGVVPLTGTELSVLHWVERHPGATPSATAEAVGLRRSNLSTALRGLVAKGMIRREADPLDSRIAHLQPTDLALASGRRVRAYWAGVLAARMPDLDEHERELLDGALEILARAVDPRP
jgi:DNA-binding MarR family transcriptional regulator